MQTASDIIKHIGSTRLAAAIGAPLGTVSAWQTRNSIPGDYWAAIVRAALDLGVHGVTLHVLAAAHDRVSAPAPAAADPAASPDSQFSGFTSSENAA